MLNQPEPSQGEGVKTIVTALPGFPGAAVCTAFMETDRETCQKIAAEAAASSYAVSMPDLASSFSPHTALEQADRRWVAVWGGRVVGFIDLIGNHIAKCLRVPRGAGPRCRTLADRYSRT